MNNSIRELLCEEQNKIIDSRCKYIIVSACPGSGKTYTLVKKIKKELNEIADYQGIIKLIKNVLLIFVKKKISQYIVLCPNYRNLK